MACQWTPDIAGTFAPADDVVSNWTDSQVQAYVDHIHGNGAKRRIDIPTWDEQAVRFLELVYWELRALRQRQERTDAHLEAVFRPGTPEE